MDAKRVREISKIIYGCFVRLNSEEVEDFNKECLPTLVSEVMTQVCKKFTLQERRPEDFKNTLINKTIELCKFLDNVRADDIRMLYNTVGVAVEMRYENYDVYYSKNLHICSGSEVTTLEAILANQSENVILSLFSSIENRRKVKNEYPKYYMDVSGSLIEVSWMMIKHLDGTGQKVSYGIKKDRYSHIFEHHLNCDEQSCVVCNLDICMCCGQAEAELTTHCYGRDLPDYRVKNICESHDAGSISELNYMFGVWYKRCNSSDAILNRWKDFQSLLKSLYGFSSKIFDIDEYVMLHKYVEEAPDCLFDDGNTREVVLDNIRKLFLIPSLKFNNTDYSNIFLKQELDAFTKELMPIVNETKFGISEIQKEELVDYYIDFANRFDINTNNTVDVIRKLK